MLVFWKQRLVILSVPKTGTTALEEVLAGHAELAITRPPELKHTPAYRYERMLKPYLRNSANADFTAIAVMREPVDWLGSWFRFRQRGDLGSSARSTAGMDFAGFVRGYMRDPRPEFADVGGQARFLSGMGGAGLGVDRLFCYERPEELMGFLEARLGRQLVLPTLNVSPPGDLTLPVALEDELRRYLAPEYELYEAIR